MCLDKYHADGAPMMLLIAKNTEVMSMHKYKDICETLITNKDTEQNTFDCFSGSGSIMRKITSLKSIYLKRTEKTTIFWPASCLE